MKKTIFSLILFFTLTIPCFATHYEVLGIGDSIMSGYLGATFGPLPTLCGASYLNTTYWNDGIGSACIASFLSALPNQLSSHNPTKVYSIAGINNVFNTCHTTMASWLKDYASILTDVTNASAVLYPAQITAMCASNTVDGIDHSTEIKSWNANLEDWAYTNNLSMVPSYLELSDMTNDDCLSSTLGNSDGLHPNSSGDTVLGYLMYKSAVPTRSRDWGNASYPSFGHESWSWWIINGVGSISGGIRDSIIGHLHGGSLFLSNGANAVSDVLAILPNSKCISISLNVTQGTPVISYRTNTSNFTRTSASSWTTYTTPFTLTSGTVQFIQIKISNINATELHVDTLALNWNASPSVYTNIKSTSATVKTSNPTYK